MQDDINNSSPFSPGRPVAGRLVSTRPTSLNGVRAWYERQNVAMQVSIAVVVVFVPLLSFLLVITSLNGHTDTTAPQSISSLDALTTPVVPTPTPTVVPTPTPVPATPTPLPDTITNPWGYDFASPGSFITAPPANFCGYFACITNFRNGQGYVVECQDGAFSLTGGVAGSCADHKGDLRALYFHPAPPPPPPPTPTPVPPTPTPVPTDTPTPVPTDTPVATSTVLTTRQIKQTETAATAAANPINSLLPNQ